MPQQIDPNAKPQPHAESPGLKAVLDAADDKDLTAEQIEDGTAWFMSDGEDEQAWDWIDVNVGGPAHSGRERYVKMKISALPRERITQIREEATQVRQDGSSRTDGIEANDKIATEGLMVPNVKGDERLLTVRGQKYLDPVDAVKARFAHKSGLIDLIANKIVELSGYGDGDVREVKAAGN